MQGRPQGVGLHLPGASTRRLVADEVSLPISLPGPKFSPESIHHGRVAKFGKHDDIAVGKLRRRSDL